jgi:phosphatidylethanolamine-binding protein (PEBP) family uncharacterized protein
MRWLLVSLVLAWPVGAMAQAAFSVVPSWDGIKACAGTPITSPSPAFRIANAPAGTAELEFRMTDLDVPNFRHGGGKVRYAGEPQITPGAFQFIGPCPPSTHRYEWTVTARNAAGQQLGVVKATRNYP